MAMDAMNLASEGRQPRFSAVVGGCFTFPWLSSAAPPHRAAAGGGRGGDVAPLGRGPRQPDPASRRRRARVSWGGPLAAAAVCACAGGAGPGAGSAERPPHEARAPFVPLPGNRAGDGNGIGGMDARAAARR